MKNHIVRKIVFMDNPKGRTRNGTVGAKRFTKERTNVVFPAPKSP